MIAIDTNVLVRLFAEDEQTQADKAAALFEAHAEENAIWIADIVLAELVWVLNRTYHRSRAEVVAVVSALMGNASVAMESAHCMKAAASLFERGPADFVDCLLAAKAHSRGCAALHTFDTRMKHLPGVALL